MPTTPTSSTDPILETQVFLGRYKGPLLAGLAMIILAAAIYGSYRLYVSHRDSSAAALLAQGKTAPDYEKVISEYPSAGAAASAYLFLAREQRAHKQYAEANETLKKFIAAHPEHELVTTAKMAMAANLDAMGQGDQALEIYRQIAANHAQSYNAPLALLSQAQMLKARGQSEEARRICETVMTQYRDSYAAMEAAQMLQTLKPVAAPTPAAPVPGPIDATKVAPDVSPAPVNPAPAPPSAAVSPTPVPDAPR